MKTPVIVALTALGTVSVFTAGGVVATQILKHAMQTANSGYEVQVSRSAMSPDNTDIGMSGFASTSPAPPEEITTAAIVAVEEAPVERVIEAVPAEPEPENTSAVLQALVQASNDVVLYDFVSAEQSSTQFENAIPKTMVTSVIDALRSGKSGQEIENMISAAAELGLITAPAALSTSDGKADARAILLSIVSEHEAATGEIFEVETIQETVAVEAPTRNQLYVVESGDSLAYIALLFYGNTEEYRVIFNANRSKINSPDRIRVGQRLIIPAI